MAKRESGRSSLGAILVGLVVLGVVAFVAGGLFGVLLKEPGLLLAYLRGDTTEISWEPEPATAPALATGEAALGPDVQVAAAEPRVAPAVASPPPAPPRAPAPKLKETAPAPIPPAVAAAPPSGARMAIQVGAFAERAGAEELRESLIAGGYPAYLAAGSDSGNARWRVRVGPYPEKTEAERVAARLKQALALPTWVLDEDAQ